MILVLNHPSDGRWCDTLIAVLDLNTGCIDVDLWGQPRA